MRRNGRLYTKDFLTPMSVLDCLCARDSDRYRQCREEESENHGLLEGKLTRSRKKAHMDDGCNENCVSSQLPPLHSLYAVHQAPMLVPCQQLNAFRFGLFPVLNTFPIAAPMVPSSDH